MFDSILFQQMSTTGCSLECMTTPVLAFNAGANPPHREGLKSHQKAVSYPKTAQLFLVDHSNNEKLKNWVSGTWNIFGTYHIYKLLLRWRLNQSWGNDSHAKQKRTEEKHLYLKKTAMVDQKEAVLTSVMPNSA